MKAKKKQRHHHQSPRQVAQSVSKPAPARPRADDAAIGSRIFFVLPVIAIVLLLGWWLFRPGPAVEQTTPSSAGVTAGSTTSVPPTSTAAPLQPAASTAVANPAIPPPAGTGADSTANPLTEANRLLQQKQYDEAIALYEKALSLNQEDEDIHYNLGIAYARKGNVDAAIKHYEAALRILPDYVEAHNNLGNLLVSRSRFDEAATHFQAALKVSPDYASAHNNYGTALRLQGKAMEAMEHFAEAARLAPEYGEARYNLGMALISADRHEEAIKELTEAVRLKPDFKPAADALAKARVLWTPGPVKPNK